jgi:DNA mismatch repair protein MutL
MGISLLDNDTINKIAAGEVIDRPASIVKELTENAVDAGASSVTVEIKDGGIALIRVTDNGSGIPKEEVRTAFLRHATSKIRSAEDLTDIRTLGFRGEALSSIAAVCRTEIITKTRSSLTGTRYVIEGGKELKLEEVGTPEGTTVIARDVFFHTPARRKFLKSPATEAAHAAEVAEHLALSNPEVAVLLIINGQTKFRTSGNGELRDIIYQLYGREIAKALIPVNEELNGLTVSGFIGRPEISRGNRNLENYCINGRYIKSNVISRGIEDGYGRKMMQHQYPFTALLLKADPSVIDVNVHPTKLEVRFSAPDAVYDSVAEAVRKALSETELIRNVELLPLKEKESSSRPNGGGMLQWPGAADAAFTSGGGKAGDNTGISQVRETADRGSERGGAEGGKTESGGVADRNPADSGMISREKPASRVRPAEPFEEKRMQQESLFAASREKTAESGLSSEQTETGSRLLSEEAKGKYRIAGTVFDTYWIVEYDGSMYIIDQHAAHEKVMYEQLMKQLKEEEIPSQELMPPVVITLTDQEEALLSDHEEEFRKAGYEIEPFGGHEFAVRAVPDILPSVLKEDLLKEMIGSLSEDTPQSLPERILEKTASMSCKAAVKGNRRISPEEASYLISELFKLSDPYNCPHGRPTIIKITEKELEKRFKRII